MDADLPRIAASVEQDLDYMEPHVHISRIVKLNRLMKRRLLLQSVQLVDF